MPGEPHLVEQLEVVHRPLLEPLRPERLVLGAQPLQRLAQLVAGYRQRRASTDRAWWT
jgi:hypothetical protein